MCLTLCVHYSYYAISSVTKIDTEITLIVKDYSINIPHFGFLDTQEHHIKVFNNIQDTIKSVDESVTKLQIMEVPEQFKEYHETYINELIECGVALEKSYSFYRNNAVEAMAAVSLRKDGNIYGLVGFVNITDQTDKVDINAFQKVKSVQIKSEGFLQLIK